MTLEILFVGLGEVGGSMARALALVEADVRAIGYDPGREVGRALQETGAIERLVLNPYKAADSADLIIMTLPPTELPNFWQDVSERLKPGAIALDCSGLSSERFRWAQSHFEEDRHFLAALPILRPELLHQLDRGLEGADPHLFQNSSLALVVPPQVPESVVNLIVGLAQAIGSQPFFVDASEMDAITSLTDTLPSLLGILLLRIAHDSPSWPDIQRLAGRSFAASVHPAGQHAAAGLAQIWIENRDSLLVHLDRVIEDLGELRSMVEAADEAEMSQELRESLAAYSTWLTNRARADWGREAQSSADQPKSGLLGDFLGLGRLRRPTKD